jgi:hypothetical protein
MKKISMLVCAAVLGFAAMGSVYADADDVAWIKKCVSDNKDQGQTSTTVEAYCTCMNNKMSSSETKSITAWEKTHKAEEEACGKESGWVTK